MIKSCCNKTKIFEVSQSNLIFSSLRLHLPECFSVLHGEKIRLLKIEVFFRYFDDFFLKELKFSRFLIRFFTSAKLMRFLTKFCLLQLNLVERSGDVNLEDGIRSRFFYYFSFKFCLNM